MGQMVITVSARGIYYVEDETGAKVAGPFESNAAAWRYIDRINNEPMGMVCANRDDSGSQITDHLTANSILSSVGANVANAPRAMKARPMAQDSAQSVPGAFTA